MRKLHVWTIIALHQIVIVFANIVLKNFRMLIIIIIISSSVISASITYVNNVKVKYKLIKIVNVTKIVLYVKKNYKIANAR